MAFLEKFPAPIRSAIDASRKHFYAAAIFSALMNVLYLAPTIYMMQVYDRVVPTGGTTTLAWLTLFLGIALGTMALLENVRSRILAMASLKLNDELANRILSRLVSSDKTQGSGQSMREFDTLRQTITGPAVAAMFDAPWTPIYFIVAFLIHPLLGATILAGGLILIFLAVLNERTSRESGKEALKANALAYSAQEALTGQVELVGALGIRKAMVGRLEKVRAQGLRTSTNAQFTGMRFNSMIKFVRMFMQSLSLGIGALLAIKGMISAGTIIAASVLLSRALQPIEQLVGSWGQIIAARRSLDVLGEVLGGEDRAERGFHALPVPAGRIQAAGITYQNAKQDAYILRNVTIALEPGKATALIGHSGAGKSTLARIIANCIRPHVGEVRIDDANYGDWDPDDLACHIGYMPQQCDLLPGTLAENISRFGMLRGESADDVAENVIAAAKLAGVHEMILRFPNAYDAVVGDPAFGMSGGQRQRIALARALYGNPKLLVLDEPNSALDSEGEAALIWAIKAATVKGAATLVVSHQPQIVNACDNLVIMRNGAIEHHGPKDTILEQLRQENARNNVMAMKRESGANV